MVKWSDVHLFEIARNIKQFFVNQSQSPFVLPKNRPGTIYDPDVK